MGDNQEQQPADYDFILEILMNAAKSGMPTPITVNSGGVLITGMLVSEAEYLKEFAGGMILDAMKRRVEGDEALRARMKEAKDDPSEREFIHIKNPQIILASGQMLPQGACPMWRGRVKSIDGYIPGQLASA